MRTWLVSSGLYTLFRLEITLISAFLASQPPFVALLVTSGSNDTIHGFGVIRRVRFSNTKSAIPDSSSAPAPWVIHPLGVYLSNGANDILVFVLITAFHLRILQLLFLYSLKGSVFETI